MTDKATKRPLELPCQFKYHNGIVRDANGVKLGRLVGFDRDTFERIAEALNGYSLCKRTHTTTQALLREARETLEQCVRIFGDIEEVSETENKQNLAFHANHGCQCCDSTLTNLTKYLGDEYND